MSRSTPSPEPNPQPGPPPSKNGGEAVNLKKKALERVHGSLRKAEYDLDADPAASGGMTPKSVMLTEGLGGEGSVWQSPLADTMRERLVEIINAMTSTLQRTTEEVHEDWSREPETVDADDYRAKWGL